MSENQNTQPNLADLAKTAKSKDDLKALAKLAREAKQKVSDKSDRPVEQIVEEKGNVTVAEYLVFSKTPSTIYHEVGGAEGPEHRPAIRTGYRLSYSLYPSRTRDEFGEPTEGVSVEVIGFPIEAENDGFTPKKDANGNLITITKDENGNPFKVATTEGEVDGQVLMIWRPQWGVDQSRPQYGRTKQDQLNLVPNRGVPRKHERTTDAAAQLAALTSKTTQPRRREQVVWTLIPGVQAEIEQVLLQYQEENSEALNLIVSKIPVASNAPSRQQQAGGAGTSGAQTGIRDLIGEAGTGDIQEDPFANNEGEPGGDDETA